MFAIVLRQELRMLLANRFVAFVLALLFGLLVLAAWNGATRIASTEANAARLNDGERTLQQALRGAAERYARDPSGDPPSAVSPGNVGLSLLGHYAVMPSGTLAALSIGQSDVQTNWYRVTAHPPHTFFNTSEIGSPLAQALGTFDVAFVLIFVMPVLIIAIGFDLLSREKEGGTLALLAAQGVRLRDLILAKATARAALFLPVLVGSLALAAWIAVGSGDAPELGPRLLGVIGVASAYALFWFALCMAVASLDLRSDTNGVLLANLWLVFVLVLPSFVNLAASLSYPAPSRVALTTEMREATELADEQAAEARDAYLFDHPELAGAGAGSQLDAFYLTVLASDAAVDRAVAPILEQFEVQARARAGVVSRLQFLSPAIAAQTALNALAGTDDARYEEFGRQVRRFHERWQDFFASRIRTGQRLTPSDFDSIPVFVYQPSTATGWRGATSVPLAFLLIVALALAALAAMRFRRYAIV
jgi:ABC-2 type transport system permease protein